MRAGDIVRSIRAARRLSQRELAAQAGVPASTIDRIESGTSDPRLRTLVAILASVGYGLVVTNQFGRPLQVSADNDVLDRGWRRLPAHLEKWDPGDYFQGDWWGWGRIAWMCDTENVPQLTYGRRRRHWDDPYYRDRRWDDAT